MTKWLSEQVTEWTSDQVTKWPSDQVTKWLSDQVKEWQEALQTIDRMVYLLFMVHYSIIVILYRDRIEYMLKV